MKIELQHIPIRELVEGFADSAENGVRAYGGKLNVRPAYQREYIYNPKQRDAVINSVRNGFPLNVMYWSRTPAGDFELMDGQQRTVSICEYCDNQFSINYMNFDSLTKGEKDTILNYELLVYICEGTEKEVLDWFQVINIAGLKLSNQEMRNAIYTGPWLADAKKYFSRTGGPAYQLGEKYIRGIPNRQEYLEKVLEWVIDKENLPAIEEYMTRHQNDTNAAPLWIYFQSIINWVKTLFPNYRSEMKSVNWGLLYNRYHENNYDPAAMEERIKELIEDSDVKNTAGIYPYLISGDEKHLGIRAFDKRDKRRKYEEQNGICVKCGGHFSLEEMEGDHIVPWSKGGHTTYDNLQMLCKRCNGQKSNH